MGQATCRLADCTTTRTASIRHQGVFQYLFAVASSESQYSRVRVRTNAKYLEGTTTRQFDVVAIGTGSAASAVASRCREAGVQVAIVDSRLRGCDPKKALVEDAEAVDWPELIRFKLLSGGAMRQWLDRCPIPQNEQLSRHGKSQQSANVSLCGQITFRTPKRRYGREALRSRLKWRECGRYPRAPAVAPYF